MTSRRSSLIRLLKQMSLLTMLLISAMVSLVVFALLIGGFSLIMQATGRTLTASGWDLLEGFASALTLSLFIGGGLFALAEYIEAEEDRKEQAALTAYRLYQNVFDKMMDPDEIAARRWILVNVPLRPAGEPVEAWVEDVQAVIFSSEETPSGIPEGQVHIKRVLNTYDFLGFVARHYWDLDEAVLDWISPMVAKTWLRLGDYVEFEAARRQEPDYYQAAREFGQTCIAWRREKGLPDAQIVRDAV